MDDPVNTVERIIELFAIPATGLQIRPFGQGLINTTYLVSTANRAAGDRSEGYILQRINPQVFPRPRQIIENMQTVLSHLNRKLQAQPADGGKKLLFPRLYPARDGNYFVTDSSGALWRLSEYLPDTVVFDTLDSPWLARETGRILGRFHALTHDLDPHRLHSTLPDFHVTPAYYRRYQALSGTSPQTTDDQARQIDRCRAYINANERRLQLLQNAIDSGELPLRTIHGDPKLNNILFDKHSRQALSLIDLDTLGPGLIHYDLADCLRSCCNPAGESPQQPGAARFDLETMRLILEEYIKQTRHFLSAEDYRYMADAVWLLPFELGLRFFTDHLENDRYFKTDHPGQNLQRALVQFQLARDIEQKFSQIQALISTMQAR